MKSLASLVLIMSLFNSPPAFSEDRGAPPTKEQCSKANTSNRAIAEDLILMIANGGLGTRGTPECLDELKGSLVLPSGQVNDPLSWGVKLGPEDEVSITSFKEQPEFNFYLVNYQIKTKNKIYTGKFSFIRVFGEEYVRQFGCAMIQHHPIKSFIRKECIPE